MSNKDVFQNTTNNFGYFREYYYEWRKTIPDEKFEGFENLVTDKSRIEFIAALIPKENKLVAALEENSKNSDEAKLLKEKGNKEFAKGQNKEALDFYSKALLKVPHGGNDSKDLAIILANRSAALYYLELYTPAVSDIDLALKSGYPKELQYKCLERKAKCLLALKEHREAFTAFRNALQSLDDSKLHTEKKLKMQTDIQIMLQVLSKPMIKNGHVNALVPGKKPESTDINKPQLTGNRNAVYESGSDKFEILENEVVGRHAVAAQSIQPGDTLLIEKPYCSVLLSEYARTNCLHCFKRTTVPYPCPSCDSVIFCGLQCQSAALTSYHKHECLTWNSLFKSGASVMVFMALRVITQKTLDYFWSLREELKKPREKPPKHYSSSDYLNLYHLVGHETLRPKEDFIERTVMALFLLHTLETVDYFKDADASCVEEQKQFIAELILHHLQVLQFNCHEISELETICVETVDKADAKFIGGGLFPTLSLFNHSCDPSVVRYFCADSVVVRAVRPLRKGEVVAENYGPIFTLNEREERRTKLKKQYWFDCNCIPCAEQWPTFQKMDKKILRLRCQATNQDHRCNNAVAVPVDTTEFMVKCTLCGEHINIFKGLKALQDTDAMFRKASVDANKGHYHTALGIYLEILTLLNEHMVPPFPDYHLCQQAIRKCMLSMGNKYLKDTL